MAHLPVDDTARVAPEDIEAAIRSDLRLVSSWPPTTRSARLLGRPPTLCGLSLMVDAERTDAEQLVDVHELFVFLRRAVPRRERRYP